MEEGFSSGEVIQSRNRPSGWWYLLPIFFGILGGIAAYLLVQDKDKKFAKKLIIVGIIMTVVWIVIGVVLPIIFSFISYKYISETFEAGTQGIMLIDSYCSNGVVSIAVKNLGTNSVTSIKCVQTAPVGDVCNLSPNIFEIKPGMTQTFTETCIESGNRICSYKLTSGTSTTNVNVVCSD